MWIRGNERHGLRYAVDGCRSWVGSLSDAVLFKADGNV